MFTENFFPTPLSVIEKMMDGEPIRGKHILEPSAGKGDIVDYLLNHEAASIMAVEPHTDLRAILATKCQLIGLDFLQIESHQVSHIDLIVMNPPFEVDAEHIAHAFTIAPPGCKIIALCCYGNYHNHRQKKSWRSSPSLKSMAA